MKRGLFRLFDLFVPHAARSIGHQGAFSLKELLARINAILRRTDPTRSVGRTFPFADLRLDMSALTARRADQAIPISRRESQIGQFFAAHPNRVIGRQELYEAEDKTILIRTRHTKGYTLIDVEDHGPGVPPKLTKMIFDEFYRVEAESIRPAPGTGLGLALVKRFAQAHQGYVRIRPAQPSGSIFQVAISQHLALSGA